MVGISEIVQNSSAIDYNQNNFRTISKMHGMEMVKIITLKIENFILPHTPTHINSIIELELDKTTSTMVTKTKQNQKKRNNHAISREFLMDLNTNLIAFCHLHTSRLQRKMAGEFTSQKLKIS